MPNRCTLFLCSNHADAGVRSCCFLLLPVRSGGSSAGRVSGVRGWGGGYRKRTKLSVPAAPGCCGLPRAKHLSRVVACRALPQGMHFHLEIAALLVNLLYGFSISSPICISRAVGHAATHHTDDLQIACRIFMQVIYTYGSVLCAFSASHWGFSLVLCGWLNLSSDCLLFTVLLPQGCG